MSRNQMVEHWARQALLDIQRAEDAVTPQEVERHLAHAQVALENARIFNRPQPTGAAR